MSNCIRLSWKENHLYLKLIVSLFKLVITNVLCSMYQVPWSSVYRILIILTQMNSLYSKQNGEYMYLEQDISQVTY